MTYLAAFPLDNAYNICQMLLGGQLEVIGRLSIKINLLLFRPAIKNIVLEPYLML